MSLTIDLESVKGICIGIAHGSLTLDEIKESAATMWELVEGQEVRMLWDLRAANFDLDVAEVSDLAKSVKRIASSADARVAFVVSGDLEFGLLRMYGAFRQTDDACTLVLRDRDEAIAWLRKEVPDT